jgi:hypothetical protein
MIMHITTEINAVHQAVQSCIQIKSLGHFRLICLVERDFADDFAKSLSAFDEIFYWIFILHVNCYGRNKLTMVDG